MTDNPTQDISALAAQLAKAQNAHLDAGYRVRDLRDELKRARATVRMTAAEVKTATAALFTSLGRKPRKAKTTKPKAIASA